MSADPSMLPVPDTLTVYGADWCADCRFVTHYLKRNGLGYRYLDLGTDPAAQAILDAAGISSIPVITTVDGRVLIEPSAAELDAAHLESA
jgi:glutaredoxin